MDCGKSTRLDSEEIERLSRQLIVRGWGLPAQERLQKSILTVSPSLSIASAYLRAAGATCLLKPGCGNELSVLPDFAIITVPDLVLRKRPAARTLICGADGTVTEENTERVLCPLPDELLPLAARGASESKLAATASAQLFAALFVMRHCMPAF